jgi:hypothetical protein
VTDRETYLVGNEDGVVLIECQREACMVPWPFSASLRMVYFTEELPYRCTPDEIVRAFNAHLRTHLTEEPSSGQWCLIHNQHQDDPAHPYDSKVCEGHHRDATPAEEAARG